MEHQLASALAMLSCREEGGNYERIIEPNIDAEQRMLGAIPGEPALGRGPAPDDDYSRHEYDHPAAGWGAARSVGQRARTRRRSRSRALARSS